MSLAHCLSALPHSMQSSIYPCGCPSFSCGVDASGRAATSSESQSLSPEQEGTPHIFWVGLMETCEDLAPTRAQRRREMPRIGLWRHLCLGKCLEMPSSVWEDWWWPVNQTDVSIGSSSETAHPLDLQLLVSCLSGGSLICISFTSTSVLKSRVQTSGVWDKMKSYNLLQVDSHLIWEVWAAWSWVGSLLQLISWALPVYQELSTQGRILAFTWFHVLQLFSLHIPMQK